jgi:VanZ family protein
LRLPCGRFHAFDLTVTRGKQFCRDWLPALIWMGLIFWGSSATLSADNTSPLIETILRWFARDLSPSTIEGCIFVIRKCAHLAEYGILAVLIWRGLRGSNGDHNGKWNWRLARLAMCCAALCAATDELHQAFVPSRTGSAIDVLIDATGAILSVIALHRLGIWRKWWAPNLEK